ncbi:MAG: hypothetical protein CMH64_01775 [Nanoarchaeota archaeon]|jgi:hypothetical protein|nr:hypothetical protein [Nanoarchaeota archaeon]|tara:strand:+ start:3053 stop:3238 length:186 start_codon:yes stop_codon:yes gene_type:complete
MKYKNTSKRVLKFRAHDSKGNKKLFELKPGKEMESDREVRLGEEGLEEVGKGTSKKSKGDE